MTNKDRSIDPRIPAPAVAALASQYPGVAGREVLRGRSRHARRRGASGRGRPRSGREVALLLLATATAGAYAARAQAATGAPVACDQAPLTQPFAHFGDFNYYKLAPGGDFEPLSAPWLLKGGATVVPGSNSWAVTGTLGLRSLSLPPGSSGQSPPTCVNAAYPTLRLYARAQTPGSIVRVSILYPTVLPRIELTVGVITPTCSWNPTLPMSTVTAILGLVAGGTAPVLLRFTAILGTSQIDDVYIDPHGLG